MPEVRVDHLQGRGSTQLRDQCRPLAQDAVGTVQVPREDPHRAPPECFIPAQRVGERSGRRHEGVQ
ncbi:hypothetical protein [Streptomyces sp. NPDC058614]|uniref:hypothetical protein n=1 Tax=Streptomyces sp. NPDC058614 TaxID=3346557 RepID=UPI00364C46D3